MSTRYADGTPREAAYHRGCTFDGGDPSGPPCANPATWHVLHTEGNRYAPRLACGKHLSIALTGAGDFHTVGACCGEPGARWQFGHNQGESSCSQGGSKQRLGADLFAPDEMKR